MGEARVNNIELVINAFLSVLSKDSYSIQLKMNRRVVFEGWKRFES